MAGLEGILRGARGRGGGGRGGGGGGGAVRAREREEQLLVFGYSCKLFRDDERAGQVDQGRLLIPHPGQPTLRVDRYDARGALHDLASLEAPPGGHDWRLELTDAEWKVEQLCDKERYRAMYSNEDEEQMYKEEELKRLHTAGYGQIGFNYDQDNKPSTPPPTDASTEPDEPFVLSARLKALMPPDIVMPDTQKLNAIIEKTASFISRQGAQMEILLRAKQAGNIQFEFLNKDCPLHRYYDFVVDAMKKNVYFEEAKQEQDVKPDDNGDYLHPSLAAPLVEAAPSIPSIHYKPSADCDYTMLISKIKGTPAEEEQFTDNPVPPGELAPPGTEPLVLPDTMTEHDFNIHYYQYYEPPTGHVEISRAPVLYGKNDHKPPSAFPHPPPPYQVPPAPIAGPPPAPTAVAVVPPSVATEPLVKSTGLNLMHYYNSGSESEHSDGEEVAAPSPPSDVQVIISKMAAYVARNGDEFEDIVKAKNDPRFSFLQAAHVYHPFYRKLMLSKRAEEAPNQRPSTEVKKAEASKRKDDKKEERKKVIVPVSFSIKKLKEPESVLPKPALPYESSSEEESEPKDDESKPTENIEEPTPKVIQPILYPPAQEVITHIIPNSNKIDLIVTAERNVSEKAEVYTTEDVVKIIEKTHSKKSKDKTERKHKKSKKTENGDSSKKSKSKKHRRKRSRSREKKRVRSRSRDKEKSGSCEKTYKEDKSGRSRSRDKSNNEDRSGSCEKIKSERKASREKSNKEDKGEDIEKSGNKEDEIITIGDDDLIDLTGDISDGRGDGEAGSDKTKQLERKRRAAAFLAAVGKDATAVIPPPVMEDNTLASAMVQTLVGLRAKKEEEERLRARRARRKRKEEEARKSRERERAHRKSKRRRRRSTSEEDSDNYEGSSKRRKRSKDKIKVSKKRRHSSSSSRHSESPQTKKPLTANSSHSTPSDREEDHSHKSQFEPFDAQDIKDKLRRLREESDEERKRWRAVTEERQKEREYSEGEWKSSEGSSDVSDTE